MRFWPVKEKRETLSSRNEAWITDFLAGVGSNRSACGANVTADSAIGRTIAVYACVGLIADTAASLPMVLYADGANGERTRSDVPLARVLHRRPNPEMTAQEFYESAFAQALLWGNTFGAIERSGSGVASEIWLLRPDRMTPFLIDASGHVHNVSEYIPRRGMRRGYAFKLKNGEVVTFDADDIWHPRGLSTDGFTGLSPIAVARNAIGAEQAMTDHAGELFANGAVPASVLTIPAQPGGRNLTEDEKKKTRDSWRRMHSGSSRGKELAILEGGIEWKNISLPPEDLQFLESRKFQVSEIARLFRVPPHLVGDVERSTSWGTGIEQQNLGFLTYTLRPWLSRFEQALDRDCGSGRSGKSLRDLGYIPEFLVDGLLRADAKTRAETQEIRIRSKTLLPDEARRMENLSPIEGGDKPFVPLNMGIPSEQAPAGAPPAA